MAQSLFVGSSNIRRPWATVPPALTKTSTLVTCTTLSTLSASLAKGQASSQVQYCVIEVLPNFIVDCANHLTNDNGRLLAIKAMLSEFCDIISPFSEANPKVL